MKTSLHILDQYSGYRGREAIPAVIPYKQVREMVAAAKHPRFLLARFRLSCGMERVFIYAHDPASPSQKMLVGAGPAKIMDRLIRTIFHGVQRPVVR